MDTSVPLIISVRDARRLDALLESPLGQASPVAALLESELLRAELREPDRIPPDVVTMNSEVVCVDDTTGVQRILSLVYPKDGGREGSVSVLAPVGAALLGLSTGQSIDWPMPGGRQARLRVSEVRYQPEASGLLE